MLRLFLYLLRRVLKHKDLRMSIANLRRLLTRILLLLVIVIKVAALISLSRLLRII